MEGQPKEGDVTIIHGVDELREHLEAAIQDRVQKAGHTRWCRECKDLTECSRRNQCRFFQPAIKAEVK